MGINNFLTSRQGVEDIGEYLFVGHPDAKTSKEIIQEKEYFIKTQEDPLAIVSYPHLTFFKFYCPGGMEGVISRMLQHVTSNAFSFEVTLDRFTAFPKHAIVLTVEDPSPFLELARRFQPIADYISNSGYLCSRLVTCPHVTIARNLSLQTYKNATRAYAERNYYASFVMEELVLLRRQQGQDKYENAQIFRFKPMEMQYEPVTKTRSAVQKSLFQ